MHISMKNLNQYPTLKQNYSSFCTAFYVFIIFYHLLFLFDFTTQFLNFFIFHYFQTTSSSALSFGYTDVATYTKSGVVYVVAVADSGSIITSNTGGSSFLTPTSVTAILNGTQYVLYVRYYIYWVVVIEHSVHTDKTLVYCVSQSDSTWLVITAIPWSLSLSLSLSLSHTHRHTHTHSFSL